MARNTPKVTLIQWPNPKWATGGSKDEEYLYEVKQAQNYVGHNIGDKFLVAEVDKLIQAGIDVTIKGCK